MRRTAQLVLPTARIAASVVAVIVLMVLPGRLAGQATGAPVPPEGPVPAEQEEPVAGSGWTAERCPGGAVGCEAPTVLDADGTRLALTDSHRQAVRRGDPGSRTFVAQVSASEWGGRWVLVGASGSSSASQLSVAFGDAESAPLSDGALTLLPVPGRGEVKVTVTDYGRAGAREVLHIEEYVGR